MPVTAAAHLLLVCLHVLGGKVEHNQTQRQAMLSIGLLAMAAFTPAAVRLAAVANQL